MITALLVAVAWPVAAFGAAIVLGRAVRLAETADSASDYWVDDTQLTRP